MKKEVIDLIRNSKLKNIALNGGDVEKAIQINSKVASKSESDKHAQDALIWELKGESLRSEQCAKQALAADTLEKLIGRKPSHSRDAAIWYELTALKAMTDRVNSVFGENAFNSIDIYFNNRY